MGALLSLVGIAAGITSLVCFILVVIQMFKRGETGIGIACVVLIFCGIGALIAFIYGWVKANEWGIQQVMMIWSAAIVIGILANVLAATMFGGAVVGPNFPQ